MSSATTFKITKQVSFARRHNTRRRDKPTKQTAPVSPPPTGRVPRISRLMALAIRFQQLIDDGVVESQAEVARLSHITRARVTQIMNLNLLAPDIQEAILTPSVAPCLLTSRLQRSRPPWTKTHAISRICVQF